MKKYQLLEKAMRDYPAGTKFRWFHPDVFVSDGIFSFDDEGSISIDGGYAVFNGDKWASIIPESILSGKCAIQVNNEREFKLLMEHYESKGWISQYIDINKYPYYIDYKDKFDSAYNKSAFESSGEKIIPFKDFAAEFGIKVPVFVMTSEDGVPLYVGDSIFEATLNTTPDSENYNKWYLVNARGIGYWIADDNKNSRWISSPEKSKAFSTKEAAEAWIKEANNKDITLALNSFLSVTINGHGIIINNTGTKMKQLLFNSELTQIIESYNKYINGGN